MALHVLVFNSQPPWRRQVEMKDICSDEERYCRDFWNPKGDLLGFCVCWASRVNFFGIYIGIITSFVGQNLRGKKTPWTFQDMSSEYTGIIGVGTADDGGAEFEDLWLHSGTVPCHQLYFRGRTEKTRLGCLEQCYTVY